MHSPSNQRFQPSPQPDAFFAHGGDAARVRITRVNARAPMSRADQRMALLIWVCSVCAALLMLSEVIKLLYRASKALAAS